MPAQAASHRPSSNPAVPEVAALVRALVHLTASGGGEVARLAEALHQAILLGPVGLIPGAAELAGRLPFPYRLPYRVVAAGLDGVSALLRPTQSAPPSAELPWLRLMAVLNGVYGDALAEQGSPLAMAMTLRDAQGQLRALPRTDKPVWLYVHGLCGIDTDWHTPDHAAFAASCAARGEPSVYLRMNSGLAIWQNGQLLDALLQAEARGPLVLVAHSLGGLVVRSAMALASERQSNPDVDNNPESAKHDNWLPQLERVVFLGTPHAGAPLERAGHLLTQLMPFTPYTKPFARLANIRSQAVRDLRYGAVTQEQSQQIDAGAALEAQTPLPPGPLYTMVAASLGQTPGGAQLGDGMVPVASAHGLGATPEQTLAAPALDRHLLTPLSHVGLVGDPPVYALLSQLVVTE